MPTEKIMFTDRDGNTRELLSIELLSDACTLSDSRGEVFGPRVFRSEAAALRSYEGVVDTVKRAVEAGQQPFIITNAAKRWIAGDSMDKRIVDLENRRPLGTEPARESRDHRPKQPPVPIPYEVRWDGEMVEIYDDTSQLVTSRKLASKKSAASAAETMERNIRRFITDGMDPADLRQRIEEWGHGVPMRDPGAGSFLAGVTFGDDGVPQIMSGQELAASMREQIRAEKLPKESFDYKVNVQDFSLRITRGGGVVVAEDRYGSRDEVIQAAEKLSAAMQPLITSGASGDEVAKAIQEAVSRRKAVRASRLQDARRQLDDLGAQEALLPPSGGLTPGVWIGLVCGGLVVLGVLLAIVSK